MLENELIEVDMVLDPNTENPNIIENKIKPIDRIVTVKEYLSKPSIIDNLKLPEIKKHLKHYKSSFSVPTYYRSCEKKNAKNAIKLLHDFTLMGPKKVLYDKLKHFFEQQRLAIIIQKNARRYFTKIVLDLMGPAKFNRKICVNDSDFYTMEPLINISFDNFIQ